MHVSEITWGNPSLCFIRISGITLHVLGMGFISLYFGQTGSSPSLKSRPIFHFFDCNYDWENDQNIDCSDRTQSGDELICFQRMSRFLTYLLKSKICGNFSVYTMWKLFVHDLEKLQVWL